jgi:RNA polymerase sigma-B factor
VQLYLPLVEALSDRYRAHGLEREELVQAGSVGLLDAIERFDPKRGDEFAAFAVPTIVGGIKQHLRNRARTVRLPPRLEAASARLPSAWEGLIVRLGRPPDARELAQELGVSESDLPLLHSPAGPPDVVEAVEATADGDPDAHLTLTGPFDVLDDTERQIVHRRLVREVSRREAAAELGMTADQLRRRTRVALAKLRAELEDSAFPAVAAESDGPAPEPEPAPEADRNGAPGPAQPRKERGGRILVRMPPPMHEELAQAAEREGVSLNTYLTNVLGSALRGEQQGTRPVPRWLPAAIVMDMVLLALLLVAAVTLLVLAWRHGW